MNLKTYAEKSQGKKFSHLLDEARRRVTPGAVGMHLGNKERTRLSVKSRRKVGEKIKSLVRAFSEAEALSLNFSASCFPVIYNVMLPN